MDRPTALNTSLQNCYKFRIRLVLVMMEDFPIMMQSVVLSVYYYAYHLMIQIKNSLNNTSFAS